MFQTFYDSNRNVAFIIKYKTGSNLLHMIIEESSPPGLSCVTPDEFLEIYLANPKIQIVTTIRNPKIAYFSGAHQILGPDSNSVLNATGLVSHYTKKLRKIVNNWEGQIPNYNFSDGHCSHYIWTLLYLIASGKNIKIIPLNLWSDYLIEYYPEAEGLINVSKSPVALNDFSTEFKKNDVETTFMKAFKATILEPQKDSVSPNTWENWMVAESKAFDRILMFLEDGNMDNITYALNMIAASNAYWHNTTIHPILAVMIKCDPDLNNIPDGMRIRIKDLVNK